MANIFPIFEIPGADLSVTFPLLREVAAVRSACNELSARIVLHTVLNSMRMRHVTWSVNKGSKTNTYLESSKPHTRSLYARTNMIVRKFSECSIHTKIMIFRAYRTSLYGCQLVTYLQVGQGDVSFQISGRGQSCKSPPHPKPRLTGLCV